jgi:PKD repeat protein
MFSINKSIYSLITVIYLLLSAADAFSQKDNEFWFAVPPVTEAHSAEGGCGCISNNRCGAAPASFNFTNTNNVPATVTIEQPANAYDPVANPTGFHPMVITIPANSFHREVLWGNDLCDPDVAAKRKLFENRIEPGDPTKVLKKGIYITSTEFITVYYEMEEQNNSDIYALKGENGLGDLFYVPFQTNKHNHDFGSNQPAYSSIDIVAADGGNTRVWVYPTEEIIGYGQPDSFYIDLKQGESVSLSPGKVKSDGTYDFYGSAGVRLSGTKIRVEGGKRVAVTISDDSVHGDSGCFDLVGDQMVPVESIRSDGSREPIIGTEYVIMKGSLGHSKGGTQDWDRIYIVATEDHTDVTITDVSGGGGGNLTINNMMSQDQEVYEISTENPAVHVTYIESTKPVYVLHVTGAGGGCEIGGAVIPTVSACTGSFDVGFSRGTESGKDFLVNVMVREENDDDSARYAFEFNGVDKPLWGDQFTKIPGSHWWTAQFDLDAQVGEHSRNMISNSKEIFHLGTLNGGKSNGGNYGYFSNYSMVEGRSYVSGIGQPGIKLCYAEEVQLVADGGLEYEWLEFDDVTKTYKPGRFLSDHTVQKPIATPFSSIKYSVVVKGASCAVPDTVGVELLVADSLSADFKTDVAFGCAPLTVNVTNNSHGNEKNQWYINEVSRTLMEDPDTFMFYNNTDTAQDYKITLVTRNKYCIKIMEKEIRVFPEINAGFAVDDSLGCSPLQVHFTNMASGNIDTVTSSGFRWDFDDLGSSDSIEPTHIFQNFTDATDTFLVSQIVTSPFLCRDTATKEIAVHPHIEAHFAMDPSISCSPLNMSLKPENSIGVDTYVWHIYDDQGHSDSLYTATNKDPIPISHNDTSQASPDTIFVGLVARNDEGCWDTVPDRNITVFPEVHSLFTPSDTNICDSTLVTFTNNSIGYNLDYEWDFDNGNSSDEETPVHRFYNRNNNDSIVRNVSLITWSDEYLCRDTLMVPVIVHPFVFADFTVDHQNNCSPLDISIDNSSIAPTGTTFDWDMGDGTYYTLNNKNDVNHTLTNYSDTNEEIFTIELNASKGFCSSTITRDVLVYPRVRPRFNTDVTAGCQPLEVRITNSSVKNLSFDWEFGDGSSLSTDDGVIYKTFENYTSKDTVYDIRLTATNNYGCSNDSLRTVTVYSFIEADFALAETDTCSPFKPVIENDSKGGIASFDWYFGNGDTDHISLPDYTYHNTTDNVQSYNLKLRVGNNHGCYDSVSREVTVYPEVRADFTTSDGVFEDCQPFYIQFENTTNAPAVDFEWDFDDGGGSVQKNPPLHAFTNSGTIDSVYSVHLFAQSQYGCSDEITKDVIAYAYIHSQFGLANQDSCSPFPVGIDNLSKGGIDQYFWNFGDGTPESNEYEPEHSYRNQSDFVQERNLRLVVKNLHACYDTFTRKVTVYPEVVANFSTADNIYAGCQPFDVNFVNNSNRPARYFIWDFDDGTNTGTDDPSKTFRNKTELDKTFSVNLFAESIHQCTDDTTIDISAYAYTEANFNVDDDDVCYGYPIEIINKSSPGTVQYDWDMDNGTIRHDEDKFNYTWLDEVDGHVYKLKLTARNAHGCYDTVSRNIEIFPQVRAHIGLSDTAGCHPFYVSFTNMSENVQFDDNYFWDFGDGNDATISDPANLFETNATEPTKYKISLRAESDMHCWDTTSTYVTVYPQPDALFYAYPPTQFYPESTLEVDNMTNHKDIWNYDWNWGDNSIQDKKSNPDAHTYGYWGDYDVKLTVWNNYCMDSLTRQIKIFPALPIAQFDSTYRGCEPLTVTFYDHSIYGKKHSWDFGDGSTYESGPGKNQELQLQEYGEEVTHTFENDGLYNVILTVEGDGGLTQYNQIVEVFPKPEISFDVAPKTVMLPDEQIQTFNSTSVKPEFRYLWNFGDGAYSTEKEPSHLYNELGKYDVTLTMWTEHMCVDSLVKPELVSVEGTGVTEFPNAFIPNLNGPTGGYYDMNNPQSNVFHPFHDGVVEYHLEIYTRWGELVFESSDISIGWDGYINGTLAKQDVYIWRVKGTYTNGSSFVKAGDVTLLVAPEGKSLNGSH